MSTSNENPHNISLIENDISLISRNKEDFATIAEYNEYAKKTKKKLNMYITRLNETKQVICSEKARILKLILEGSLDFNFAQYALGQVENYLEKININISFLQRLDQSLIYLKEKPKNKILGKIPGHEDYSNNKKSTNNNEDENDENAEITKLPKQETIDTSEDQDFDEETKTNKEHLSKLKSSSIKTKTRNSINKNGTKNNKPKKKISNAVISILLLYKIIRNSKARVIRAHSHESDFSPPWD